MEDIKKRDGFGSSIGALLAMLGSALGVGNIIKFPALVGENGGAAFILVYIICLLVSGFPIMVAEIFIGRKAHKNNVDAYTEAGGRKSWGALGWLGTFAAMLLLAYYTLFASWVMRYAYTTMTGQLNGITDVGVAKTLFSNFNGSAEPFFWQVGFLLLAGIVLSFGVKKGIERVVKILMPLLIVILIIAVVRGALLPEAGSALKFLLSPDFSKITSAVVVTALGLSFFKLSLGIGSMVIYGSYSDGQTKIMSTAAKIIIIDLVVSVLAGFAVFSGFFSGNGSGLPLAGFDLLFESLPVLFSNVFLGQHVMFLFFFLTGIVAFTAAISILEVPIAVISEKTRLGRLSTVWIVIAVIMIVGSIPSLGNSLFSYFGDSTLVMRIGDIEKSGITNIFDYIVSNIFMPLIGMFTAILVAYKMDEKTVINELSNFGSINNIKAIKIYRWILKLTPFVLFFIFLKVSGILSLLGITI
ncbi:hypothetical protein AZF37_04270 [endosymbiont 'TC1' of Trimyema compressum]|uniref:sodium-dependent transporter n=1 Tax=endosymbiont 'TC1' of Trimyema compressum TaxID=243899 RepID=UPI0007F10741|nr:sodium-dependent transporter [endosymbiont 'TC1' of Trimyema compressum]AMP20485.1 hypothetical protein AZF37_04270 [endosymbiont 'TC1' of Trimyema compressum]